jgi:hypothetical protein
MKNIIFFSQNHFSFFFPSLFFFYSFFLPPPLVMHLVMRKRQLEDATDRIRMPPPPPRGLSLLQKNLQKKRKGVTSLGIDGNKRPKMIEEDAREDGESDQKVPTPYFAILSESTTGRYFCVVEQRPITTGSSLVGVVFCLSHPRAIEIHRLFALKFGNGWFNSDQEQLIDAFQSALRVVDHETQMSYVS